MRYTCPQGCGWPGSDDHTTWMAHHCAKPLAYADPIQQAVDDWLLMGRKARAWDELMRLYERHDTGLIHVDVAKGLVHPAQERSSG